MEALVHWFSQNLSQYISPEGAVFIISMIPLLELRGGLLAASLLKISAAKAIPLCIVGNIIPIPFILLFIRQIFKVLKKTKLFRGLVMKLEDRAMRKSDQVKKYEFWGLMLFVGIPLPGTSAAWGSHIPACRGGRAPCAAAAGWFPRPARGWRPGGRCWRRPAPGGPAACRRACTPWRCPWGRR
mgnify:CR=1 FL=1